MGYEKFVMDVEPGRHDAYPAPRAWILSETARPLDAMREVGPGKHFLGCAQHTSEIRECF